MDRWFDRSGLFVKMLASGLGTILAISLLWLWSSSYFLGKSRQAGILSDQAAAVSTGLLETRIEEKNVLVRDLDSEAFHAGQETQNIRAYNDKLKDLRQAIELLQKTPGADTATARRISEEVESYSRSFALLIGKYRELGFRDQGVRGDWNKAGERLGDLINGAGDAALLAELNELLKAERLYLLSPGQELLAAFRGHLDRIKARTADLPPNVLAGIRENADRYESYVTKHWALLQEIGRNQDQGLRARYRAAANAVDPLVQELLAAATAANRQAHAQLAQANLGIMALGILLGGAIFFMLSKIVSRPLLLATGVAERIAAGELKVDLGAIHERDVLGAALKTMVKNLTEQVREIKEGAGVLGSSTAEISAAVTQVTASATETATAVTQTMATAEELRQTSELSAQKAGHVSKTAGESAARSAEGQKALAEIASAMDHIRRQMEAIGASVIALSEQGQAIAEIIGTVDDLAEQSNILSVNASIEAAKAGEQGRGFAVVAQEIKSLAEKSKEGTARVRAILADIQKATAAAVMVAEQGSKAVDKGAERAEEAGRSIRALAESIGNVDQAALQIMASSKQQFSGVEQVAAAIENIREATEQNVKSMEQLEATAASLADMGRKIVDLVGWYKV